MSFNYNKIVVNYNLYNKFLSFSKISNRELLIVGAFGSIKLYVPQNIIIEIDKKNVKIFFKSSKKSFVKRVVKPFCIKFLFSCYGLIFIHFSNVTIKGIGYKFELKEKELVVFNGNSLPTTFKVPENLHIITNGSFNFYSIIGSDYILLNNFIQEVLNIATPSKYKEIGVYVDKRM